MAAIYTIGHSTRTFDELVAALQAHEISTLIDIRAFPMSPRMPHFNRESLEHELPAQGFEYVWMKELGGRRKKIRTDSPNSGLRNASFRNYADYMLTPEFVAAIERLLQLAGSASSDRETQSKSLSSETGKRSAAKRGGNVAIMCAERVYFHCHRMLVSDYLTAHGHTVLHIDDEKHPPRPHKLMAEAHVVNGQVLYNAQELF